MGAEKAIELYERALELVKPIDHGSFYYRLGANRTQDLMDIALTTPDGNQYDVSQPKVVLKWRQPSGRLLEYVIDPNDFSQVSRMEAYLPSIKPPVWERAMHQIFGKTPRTIATQKDLNLLENYLRFAACTKETSQVRSQEERRREDNKKAALEKYRAERYRRSVDELNRKLAEREQRESNEARAIATSMLLETNGLPSPRCIALIVEDYEEKAREVLRTYNGIKRQLRLSINMKWESDPERAIRIILSLMEQAKDYSEIAVLVFMDGVLPEPYERGIKVVEELWKKLDELNLPKPYLVGEAGGEGENRRLQELYPQYYIATIWPPITGVSPYKDIEEALARITR